MESKKYIFIPLILFFGIVLNGMKLSEIEGLKSLSNYDEIKNITVERIVDYDNYERNKEKDRVYVNVEDKPFTGTAMLEADKKFHQERTEKIIEKGERIGVYVDFSQMLIDEGKEALNYREEVEGKENGTVIMKNNQTEINSYYPFPILINTGYLSGTSTVVIPSEKENVVVEFRNIRDGYVIGALANDTRKDIEKRKVVLQVTKVEMNAPQVNVEATKVEMNANDIDYNLKGE